MPTALPAPRWRLSLILVTGVASMVGPPALHVASASAAARETRAATTAAAVEIRNFTFSVPALNVAVGDSVTWTNMDKALHDATTTDSPVEFISPTLRTGESWTYTFLEPGTYDYYCSLHPQMVASVVAAPAAHGESHSAAPPKRAEAGTSAGAKPPSAAPTAVPTAEPKQLAAAAPRAAAAKATPTKATGAPLGLTVAAAPTAAPPRPTEVAPGVAEAELRRARSGSGTAFLAVALAVAMGLLLMVSYGAGARRGGGAAMW